MSISLHIETWQLVFLVLVGVPLAGFFGALGRAAGQDYVAKRQHERAVAERRYRS